MSAVFIVHIQSTYKGVFTLRRHIISDILLGGSRQRAINRRDLCDKKVVGAQFHTSLTNMSSSEEDLVAYWFRCRERRKRKYWVHPYNLTNMHHSSAVVSRELSQLESKFRVFYRMNPENFIF